MSIYTSRFATFAMIADVSAMIVDFVCETNRIVFMK